MDNSDSVQNIISVDSLQLETITQLFLHNEWDLAIHDENGGKKIYSYVSSSTQT